jgi:HSP20 family protein
MADAATKLPVKNERETAMQDRRPFENLRREIDRLFDDFSQGFWRSPLSATLADMEAYLPRKFGWSAAPAVDFVENDKSYKLTAELPGMDEKNIDVKVVDGGLMIKGEKKEEKEDKAKNYYMSERRFGSFERYFRLPNGVDAEKIDAQFKNGVLSVTLPKKPEAQKPEKKIEVKAA